MAIDNIEITAEYTKTPANTRQNTETTQTQKDNEIIYTTVSKYFETLASDEDPKTTNDNRPVMEHSTVNYDKTIVTEIKGDKEDNPTTSELDPLTTITVLIGKVEETTENYPETGPDTQAMLDAETSEEATIDDHIHALEITNEKSQVLKMTEDKDILFTST